jgi:glycosyltransferase involved in cell wall biosynthesis
MKVVFFTHTVMMGGAEQSLVDLALNLEHEKEVVLLGDGELSRVLKEKRIKHSFVSLEDRGEKDLKLVNLIFGFKLFLNLLAKVNKKFCDEDLIYANSNKAYIISWLVKLLFFRKFNIVWHLRDSFDRHHFGYGRYLICASTRFLGVNVVCNSVYTQACFYQSFGRGKAHVIYNGFDISQYKVGSVAIGVGKKSIIMASRISPWKGQLEVIETIASIGHKNLQLTICGAALFGENDYLEKIKTRVDELKLTDTVKFIGHVNNVPKLMSEGGFSLMIHASTSPEPFGRCIVESMLSGIPVLASGIGGVPEIIYDGTNVLGYTFNPFINDSLKIELERALSGSCETAELASRARESCVSRFSYKVLKSEINSYIQSLDFE